MHLTGLLPGPLGCQGGREGRKQGPSCKPGDSPGQLATRPPAQKASRLSPLPFCLLHSPLALKSRPQPHDPFARGSQIDGLAHPPNIRNVEFPSIDESRHHLRSRHQPTITLIVLFFLVSPFGARLLGSRLQLQSRSRWVFGKPLPPPPPLHRVRPPPPLFAFARHGVAKAIAHRLAPHFQKRRMRSCVDVHHSRSHFTTSPPVFPPCAPASHGGCANPPCSNQIVPAARQIRHPIQARRRRRKGIGASAVIDPEKQCSTRACSPRQFSTAPPPGLCPQVRSARGRIGHGPPRHYRSQYDVGAAVRLGVVIGCSHDRRKHGRRPRAASY